MYVHFVILMSKAKKDPNDQACLTDSQGWVPA